MPSIGTLTFSITDGYESGIALRLVAPPEDEISATYQDCQFLASPDIPYAICRFSGATSRFDAFSKGKELLQKSLDLESMLGRADLQIEQVEDEQIVWWGALGKSHLVLISTVTLSAKVGAAELIVKDAQGNILQQQKPSPVHHLGFRFFRLSQVSNDLYESFRNMYLAFESLLSSHYPKVKEQEIQWLQRSLTTASPDLSLSTLCPAGTSDFVSHVIATIYTGARLPLFHAKDGKTYFAPGVSNTDRAAIEQGLAMLTELVIRMAKAWFSTRRRGGWVNLSIVDEGYRALLSKCNIVLSDQPTDLKDPEADAENARRGLPFSAVVNEHFEGAKRINISTTLGVPNLAKRTDLHAVYVVEANKPMVAVTPDARIGVDGFDFLNIFVFLRGRNANQPKYIFTQ